MKQQFVKEERVWFIQQKGKSLTTESGLSHGSLRTNTKKLDSEETCAKEVQKLIRAKTKAGYQPLSITIEGSELDTIVNLHRVKIGEVKQLNLSTYEATPALLNALEQLTEMEALEIASEHSLPASIGKLVNLKKLTLRDETIVNIPEQITQLKHLEYLELNSHYELIELPAILWELTQLKELHINHLPKVKKLPPALGKLQNLEELHIHSWQSHDLKVPGMSIPKEIGQLHQLKILALENCDLETLPEEIGSLTKLESLDLEYNRLQDLPASVEAWQSLTTINLSSNQFAHIPEGICKLKKLEQLNIKWNPLKRIEANFLGLISLKKFKFSKDNIENIPLNILEARLNAIRDFLENGPAPVKIIDVATPPPDQEEIAVARKEALENTLHDLRNDTYRESKFDEILAFIFGDTDQMPESKRSEIYSFDDLWKLLNPIQEWSFIDRRLLAFFCQDTFFYKDGRYYKGYYSEIFKYWFSPQLQAEKPDQNLFELVCQELASCHIDVWTALTAYLDSTSGVSFVRADGSINSVGKVILQYLKEDQEKILLLLKEEYYLRPVFALLRQERNLLDTLLDRLMEVYYSTSDSHKHLRFSHFEELCKIDAPAYETSILNKLTESDCVSCQMETYRILLAYFGDKYLETAKNKAKETLAYISERKNNSDSDQYKFPWFLAEKRFYDNTPDFIQWVCQHLGEDLKEDLISYVKDTKELNMQIVGHIVDAFGQGAIEATIEALKMKVKDSRAVAHYQKVFKLLNGLDYAVYYEEVWKIACVDNLDVATLACMSLAKCPTEDVFDQAQSLINSSKKSDRRAGVLVLSRLQDPIANKALEPILENEQVDEVRNFAIPAFYQPEDAAEVSLSVMQQRIQAAKQRGKLKKAPAKWLDNNTLPSLHWQDGTPLSKEEFYYLFYRQASTKAISPDVESLPMYSLLDRGKGADFAFALLQIISLKASDRMCFAIVGKLGDERIIEPLVQSVMTYQQLNACAILGLLGTYEAAQALEKIIQHYHTKYPNVRFAAEEAFASIAEQLSLTYFELKDRLLPGFDIDHTSQVKKVNDDYQMFISASLKFEFINPKGKTVKSIPKASADLKKSLKEQKTALTQAVKQFKYSLESYLVTQRTWKGSAWKKLFLAQPLAFACAQSLVWQVNSQSTFIVQADAKLMADNSKEITIQADDEIKLVHPLFLDDRVHQHWQDFLAKQQLNQTIVQIDREIAHPLEDEREIKLYRAFEDQVQTAGVFKNKARQRGWRRGSIGDGGGVLSYRKSFPKDEVEVFIETENLPVQNLYDEEVTLGKCFFTPLGTVSVNSFRESEPRHKHDQRLISLKDVPPIAFSEAMNDLEEILKTT